MRFSKVLPRLVREDREHIDGYGLRGGLECARHDGQMLFVWIAAERAGMRAMVIFEG